jgi:MFS family permease
MGDPGRAPGAAGALALLAAAQFAVAADFTVVFVALPAIGRDLPLGPQGLQWVVTTYGLTFGGFLLLAGRLADLVGRRAMFVTGHLLFGASSALAAMGGTAAVLLVARVVQGLGAALLVPATLALLHATFLPGAQRNRALGVWGAAGASGGALGVVAGGALTSAFGWQSVFLVNVPLSLASAGLARRWLLSDPPPRPVRGLDVLGAVWVTAGGMLLVLAIALVGRDGPTLAAVLAAAGAGILLACFGGYERRADDPLLPPRLLRVPSLVVAAAVTMIFYGSLNNQLYLLTMELQEVQGRSAAATGLLVVPYSIAIAIGTAAGARLTGRYGARIAVITGMGAGLLGVLLLATAEFGPRRAVIALVVSGLGQGAAWTGIWATVTSAAASAEQGVASGAVTAMGQFGQAAGLAGLAAVLATVDDENAVTGSAVRVALLSVAAVALLGVLAATRLPRDAGISRQPVGTDGR